MWDRTLGLMTGVCLCEAECHPAEPRIPPKPEDFLTSVEGLNSGCKWALSCCVYCCFSFISPLRTHKKVAILSYSIYVYTQGPPSTANIKSQFVPLMIYFILISSTWIPFSPKTSNIRVECFATKQWNFYKPSTEASWSKPKTFPFINLMYSHSH